MQHFIPFLTSTSDATFYHFPYTPNAKLYLFPYLHFKCNNLSIYLLPPSDDIPSTFVNEVTNIFNL